MAKWKTSSYLVKLIVNNTFVIDIKDRHLLLSGVKPESSEPRVFLQVKLWVKKVFVTDCVFWGNRLQLALMSAVPFGHVAQPTAFIESVKCHFGKLGACLHLTYQITICFQWSVVKLGFICVLKNILWCVIFLQLGSFMWISTDTQQTFPYKMSVTTYLFHTALPFTCLVQSLNNTQRWPQS